MLTQAPVRAIATLRSLLHRGERGQDLIEYSMLGGLLAGAIILVAYIVLTGAVESMFTGIGNCLDWDGGSDCLP